MSTPAGRPKSSAPRGLNAATLARLAWRESRTARRRLALYMSSIALGLAALVAIDSFAGNVTRSIREQSRSLLGGDLQISSRAALAPLVDSLLDSLNTAGTRHATVTSFASMALAETSGNTRLVQVRAISDGYPYYGTIETSPANLWRTAHDEAPTAFVDPALLVALNAEVGDSLRLGRQTFVIAATIANVPGDAGITSIIGPRVFVSSRWLEATGLVEFGSRAEYEVVLRLPDGANGSRAGNDLARSLRRQIDPRDADAVAEDANRDRAAAALGGGERLDDSLLVDEAAPLEVEPARVRVRTVADTERDFTEAVSRLADFLSVIGLIALLLGGIGVASGIHAFVVSKIDTVAVLRCLGASSRQVLALYVLQAGVMGLVGAFAGTALGVAIQFALPRAVAEFLPLDVAPTLEWRAIGLGLAIGIWVSLIFALRPLLALRRVSPLQALRRATDNAALPSSWRDPARLGVDVLLVASIVGIAIARTGAVVDGLAVSFGITVAVLVLWAASSALIRVARGSVRSGWPFALRQGIANLYRPANQTRAVTLALGFGAFLLSTVFLVQENLLKRFEIADAAAAGNLLFFDVQDDQITALDSIVTTAGYPVVERTPIVTMRVAGINGVNVQRLLNDTTVDRSRWTLRREYRSTYADTLPAMESVVIGEWTNDSAERERRRGPDGPFEISLEQGLATDMQVALGDTIDWDVQGVRVRTLVTSFRTVDWARFETNFFVVFASEALRAAPQQFVLIADVDDPTALARIQRDAVRRFPNVSSLDLSVIRSTIGAIVDRVTVAIRFLGVFCLAIGVPVLFSAVAATRRARLREGVLLRTLGASRAMVQRVLFTEYAALGVLGAFTGMLLAFGGAWALMHWVFEDTFVPAWGAALAIVGATVALTVGIGLLTSRDVHRETPMAVLRDA